MSAAPVDRYAVIGNPIAHSKSPQIHTAFAHATGQAISYERLFAPLDAFAETLRKFASEFGRGANVTLPFKQEAYALAREHTGRATAAGACNTLAWQGNHWLGDNTDGAGLMRDLVHNRGERIEGRRVLVLGAGGATRGILEPLLGAGPARLVIANRTPERAASLVRLAAQFDKGRLAQACSLDDLAGQPFDLVINATSAGFTSAPAAASAVASGAPAASDAASRASAAASGAAAAASVTPAVASAGSATPQGAGVHAAPWTALAFADDALAYDLSYADHPTSFMRWCSQNGAARVADGLGMLLEQAAESFLLWRGVRPDTRDVAAMLRPGSPVQPAASRIDG